MAATLRVFRTPELAWHIIGFLRSASRDLQSCSLAIRTFTFPAQSFLFERVAIKSENAAMHLGRVLDSAPHLALLIRGIDAQIISGVLAHVRKLPLPNLHTLALAFRPGMASPLGPSVLTLMQELLALPTLQTVKIAATLASQVALEYLFSQCSPSLRFVDFHHIIIRPTMHGRIPVIPIAKRREKPRARLSGLLPCVVTSEMATWLLSPRCPFDFGGLRMLDIRYQLDAHRLLGAAAETIQTLRLSLHGYQQASSSLTDKPLPVLTTLKLEGPAEEIYPVLDTIGGTSSLERIMLLLHRRDHDTTSLIQIDNVLAAALRAPSSHLSTVSVAQGFVHLTMSPIDAQTFPKLTALGLLEIRDSNEWRKRG